MTGGTTGGTIGGIMGGAIGGTTGAPGVGGLETGEVETRGTKLQVAGRPTDPLDPEPALAPPPPPPPPPPQEEGVVTVKALLGLLVSAVS